MEPNEIKQQLDRISNEVKEEGIKAKAEVLTAIKDKAATADVEAIKHAFNEYVEKTQEQINKLTEAAEKQGLVITGLTEKNANVNKSQGEVITDALEANKAAFEAMKMSKTAPGVNMALKTAATMTTANILPSVSTAIPHSLMMSSTGGIVGIPTREPYLREILNARPMNSMYEYWVEAVNRDGGADTVAEGAAKPALDIDFQERTAKAEKIAAHAKMSKEILADVAGMRNFIEEEIQTSVELKLDAQLYNGNGTTPNLKGLVTWGTTLSVASSGFETAATGVNFANNYDVVIAAKAIMQTTYFFTPNVILVNPLDYGLMQVGKTADGVYVIPPFAQSMGLTIAGVRVIANAGVTAGNFVIMDTSKVRLRIREEFNIDYGYVNDDFTKNLVTVLGELRALLYLPTNYAGAVLKGTFATVRAAMETA